MNLRLSEGPAASARNRIEERKVLWYDTGEERAMPQHALRGSPAMSEPGKKIELKVRVKGNASLQGRPRVYFTCHPADFARSFDRLCEDLFAAHDCAVYYTEDMTARLPEETREADLGQMNLFVIPVSGRLLTEPNRAMSEDFPLAVRRRIPVLPILLEPGLDAVYSRPDRFGALQYLFPDDRDATAIPYAEKLKKYLGSVLVGDELAARVRAAFDAYIFLSYRKKDRRYANALMRLIHRDPVCRDLAIWYDEFLTPGESFSESIGKILADSRLFTLLVTPNLVIEDNYIRREEYPAAVKAGIPILPAIMEDTDEELLRQQYAGIPACADARDEEAFQARLRETLTGIAKRENDTDPAHNYLIGLAYLEGIDVEVDRERALELITGSAEAELPEAMEKLRDMYDNGIGVPLDYRQALLWQERLVEYYTRRFGKEHIDTMISLSNAAILYGRFGNPEKERELMEEAYALSCRIMGEEHPETIRFLDLLACSHSELGEHAKALALQKKAFSLSRRVLGEEHPDTLRILKNLAVIHNEMGRYDIALGLLNKVYTLRRRTLGEEHPDTLSALSSIALAYGQQGKPAKELELEEKIVALSRRALGEEHPDTIKALGNLAATFGKIGNHTKALEWNEKVYASYCRVLGEAHPETLIALSNLASEYNRLGNHAKARELNERALALSRRAFGEEHPGTLTSMNNLASTYSLMGEYEKARELNDRAYTLSCRALGADHPHTLIFLRNLASVFYKMEEAAKAQKLYEKTYTLSCRVLGEEHPETITSLSELAGIWAVLGNRDKARKLREKVYFLRRRSLGDRHPDTIKALKALAAAVGKAGDLKREAKLEEQLFDLCRSVYGEDHRTTLEALGNLAVTYSRLGNEEKARESAKKLAALRARSPDTAPPDLSGSIDLPTMWRR